MQREKSEKQLERTVEKPFFLKELDMEIPPPPPKKKRHFQRYLELETSFCISLWYLNQCLIKIYDVKHLI